MSCSACQRGKDYEHMRLCDALKQELNVHDAENCSNCHRLLPLAFVHLSRKYAVPVKVFPVQRLAEELLFHARVDRCCACNYLLGVLCKAYHVHFSDGRLVPDASVERRVRWVKRGKYEK